MGASFIPNNLPQWEKVQGKAFLYALCKKCSLKASSSEKVEKILQFQIREKLADAG